MKNSLRWIPSDWIGLPIDRKQSSYLYACMFGEFSLTGASALNVKLLKLGISLFFKAHDVTRVQADPGSDVKSQ